MNFTKLTNFVTMWTLSMFNTGQVTLPKKWRDKFKTDKFIAVETSDGLLIQPIGSKGVTFYESKDSFGIYSEEGLDSNKIKSVISEIDG